MPPCRDGVLKTPILANTSKSLLAPMQSADPISWCSDSLQASLLGALGHCRLNIQSSHHWLPFLKKGSPLATARASTEARPQNPMHRPGSSVPSNARLAREQGPSLRRYLLRRRRRSHAGPRSRACPRHRPGNCRGRRRHHHGRQGRHVPSPRLPHLRARSAPVGAHPRSADGSQLLDHSGGARSRPRPAPGAWLEWAWLGGDGQLEGGAVPGRGC